MADVQPEQPRQSNAQHPAEVRIDPAPIASAPERDPRPLDDADFSAGRALAEEMRNRPAGSAPSAGQPTMEQPVEPVTVGPAKVSELPGFYMGIARNGMADFRHDVASLLKGIWASDNKLGWVTGGLAAGFAVLVWGAAGQLHDAYQTFVNFGGPDYRGTPEYKARKEIKAEEESRKVREEKRRLSGADEDTKKSDTMTMEERMLELEASNRQLRSEQEQQKRSSSAMANLLNARDWDGAA